MENQEKITTVFVDKELCIGCGACMNLHEEIFEISNEDGLAHVILEPMEKDKLNNYDEDVYDAADACPTSAIKINEK